MAARREEGSERAEPIEPDGAGRDRVLVVGLLAVVGVAALLRLPNLDAGLPQLVGPDEPTVMDQARLIAGGIAPDRFDWPPLASEILAGGMVLTPGVDAASSPYLFARALFVAVALAVVVLAGVLGARLAGPGDGAPGRRLLAWGAAGLTAVSFLSVRLSRQVHPEHLQLLFMLASVLVALAYDRRRRWSLAATAGALAGLAGASKYLGVLAVLPVGGAILWSSPPWAARARHLSLAAAATVAGFVVGAPVILARPAAFVDGLGYQFAHQGAAGHLGYDAEGTAWWFHLSQSLPGNWGWPITVAAVAGVIAAAWRGTRPQRLVLGLVVPVFVTVGLFRVRFPHYVLIVVPFLAPMAVLAARRALGVLGLRRARACTLAGAAVALAALPTAVDDVRLLRVGAGADTRTEAAALVEGLPGEVWAEPYSVPLPVADQVVASVGVNPGALGCDCFLVLSSYMEDRFRAEPARYATAVRAYDAVRRSGEVVAVVEPTLALDYDWDLLPGWGLGRVRAGLDGGGLVTGPTLTVIDLRSPAP